MVLKHLCHVQFAACVIQRNFLGLLCVLRPVAEYQAAVHGICSLARGELTRRRLKKFFEAIVKIQAMAKGMVTRLRHRRMMEAVTKIQANWKRYREQKKFILMRRQKKANSKPVEAISRAQEVRPHFRRHNVHFHEFNLNTTHYNRLRKIFLLFFGLKFFSI